MGTFKLLNIPTRYPTVKCLSGGFLSEVELVTHWAFIIKQLLVSLAINHFKTWILSPPNHYRVVPITTLSQKCLLTL
jgi:hypothetical protein